MRCIEMEAPNLVNVIKKQRDSRESLAYREYAHNPKYREYVDKYCHMHGLELDEAMRHHIVKVEAYNYYSDL